MDDTSNEHGFRAVCHVELSEAEVFPGAPLRWRATVEVGEPPRDVRGFEVRLCNEVGVPVGRLEVAAFDGRTNRTLEGEVVAPAQAGAYAWQVVVPPQSRGSVNVAETTSSVPFTVRPHPIRANAWGLPPAPVAGRRVPVRVGAKGGDAEALAGRGFEVVDEDAVVVVSGRFGVEPMAGSAGLYDAAADLPTPDEPGVRRWTLRVAGFEEPSSHAAASHDFSVRTVPQPDCTVVVTVVDHVSGAPLPGAEVVFHPFRGLTDVDGVVTVAVAAGPYRMFASKTGYDVHGENVEVADGASFRAELFVEIEEDPGDRYA